jgi:Sel1 repeat
MTAQNRACHYHTTDQVPPCLQKPYRSDPDMTAKIEKMLSKVGIRRNFDVLECAEVNNAMAAVVNQELFILFNRRYLNRNLLTKVDETDLDLPSSSAEEDWALLGVLAHEVGHHIHEHLLLAANPNQELQADEWSGFMLYQLGATLNQAMSGIFRYIVDNHQNTTHPPKSQRLTAVETGWRKAAAQYGYNNEQNYAKEWQLPSSEDVLQIIHSWKPTMLPQLDVSPQIIFEQVLKVAKEGQKHAQYRIGVMYQQGIAVPVDYTKAKDWYEKAAAQGHAAAQNNLGWMYQQGLGTAVNYQQAFYWYQKSAEQKNAFGTSNLAYLYDKGIGVFENKDEANRGYCRAAAQGNWLAKKVLSILSVNCQ